MNNRIRVILDILFILSPLFTTALSIAYTVLLLIRVITCAVTGCSFVEYLIGLVILSIVSIVLFAVLMVKSS